MKEIFNSKNSFLSGFHFDIISLPSSGRIMKMGYVKNQILERSEKRSV